MFATTSPAIIKSPMATRSSTAARAAGGGDSPALLKIGKQMEAMQKSISAQLVEMGAQFAEMQKHMGTQMSDHAISLRQTAESVQNLEVKFKLLQSSYDGCTAKLVEMEQRMREQDDIIREQGERLSAPEKAGQQQSHNTDPSQTHTPSGWKTVPPSSVPATLQFRVTGIREKDSETDSDLALAVKEAIKGKMEANEAYLTKESDKVEFTIDKVRRMGKMETDKPRLVHITVATHFDAASLIRNRRFLKGSGVSVLDFRTPEELKNHRQNLPKFLEARKDPSKWVSFIRGVLTIKDRANPRIGAHGGGDQTDMDTEP